MTVFSLRPYVAEGATGSRGGLFHKDANLIRESSTLLSYPRPKGPASKYHHVGGLTFNTRIPGHTSVHPVSSRGVTLGGA